MRLAALAVLALAGGLAPPASAADAAPPVRLAQVGPPIRLGPPVRLAPPKTRTEEPARPVPGAPRAAEPLPGSPAGASPRISEQGVEAETLGAPDPASVGLIDDTQGGLGATMWRGTDRALVVRLLPQIPARTASRVARLLAVRLLTTRAEAPRGSASGEELLAARVERLVAFGEVDAASRLAALAAVEGADERLAKAAIEALFLRNDNAGACQRTRGFVRRFKDAYWQRALAFCLSLSGERVRAGVVTDILRERGDAQDRAFFVLMEALARGGEPNVDSLPDPSGLDLAMMRAANARLPADVLSSDRPAVLRSVATSPNAPLDLRLEAAERAFAYGAIVAETLNELYAAVPFEVELRKQPMTAAEQAWGPKGRALLLRAAAVETGKTAKVELLRRAFELGREKGGYEIVLRASVPILKTIPPDPGLAWFARDAVVGLLSEGQVEQARAWLALVGSEATASAEARDAATRLWALDRLAASDGATGPLDPAQLAGWERAVGVDTSPTGRRKAVLLLSLFEALGVPNEPGRWASFVAGTPAKPAAGLGVAWSNALAEAAHAHRVGETVLIALLGLGRKPEGTVDTAAVGAAVGALREVGLAREARALALETAVMSGL